MLPNLISTKYGRFTAFFFLYMTEGMPLGFTATALSTQMRRQGLGPKEVSAFIGTLYLPWAFKWIVAPFVDMFSSKRFGHRRLWIFLMQIGMTATLLTCMPIKFTQEIALFTFLPQQFHIVLNLFTLLIFVHNMFGATSDVAIDALACNTLNEDERGLANGLMFGGSYIGQAIGGPGALLIIDNVNLPSAFIMVICFILAVTFFVVLPIKEPKAVIEAVWRGSKLKTAAFEVKEFGITAFKAFTGTRPALTGVFIALLPAGAYALSLALMTNVAVEIGLSDSAIANIGLVTTICAAAGCIMGGFISDRIGRRKALASYVFLTALPTLYFGYMMYHYGWIMPVEVTGDSRPLGPEGLVLAFWISSIAYSFFQGLTFGTRTALFMDVCCPKVAGTQFTAYMSLMNLTISYSAWWQGVTIEKWGYPATLALDALLGIICIALLPMMKPVNKEVALSNSQ